MTIDLSHWAAEGAAIPEETRANADLLPYHPNSAGFEVKLVPQADHVIMQTSDQWDEDAKALIASLKFKPFHTQSRHECLVALPSHPKLNGYLAVSWTISRFTAGDSKWQFADLITWTRSGKLYTTAWHWIE